MPKIKHGLTGHPLHNVWITMRQRCSNPNAHQYKDYGGRNIKVCDEWNNDFQAFYDWCMENGWKKGLQIDRRNNNKNYGPTNCHFVVARKNSLNRRLIRNGNKTGYNGITVLKSGKYRPTIKIKQCPIYLGEYFTIEEALTTRNQYIINNNLQKDYKIQSVV